MTLFLQCVLCYLTLFLVIWTHEVGHAFLYWRYGCKKNPLHVTVRPTLFFSTPAPLDMEKLDDLTPNQVVAIGYGGIVVNLFCAAVAFGILGLVHPAADGWMRLFLWLFGSLHFAEAVSYLFLGNIYLVSDMASIAQKKPRLRWVNFLAGILFCAVYILLLCRIPEAFFGVVLIVNLLTVLCMGGGRIVFTWLNSRKSGAEE